MEFLVNELSIHGQFADIHAFESSLKRTLQIRERVRNKGLRLYCSRRLLTQPVYEHNQVNQVLMQPRYRTIRSQVLTWLSKEGPFWDMPPEHNFQDDYFFLAPDEDMLVTDSSLAEAAFRVSHKTPCSTISFSPSNFGYSPIPISWHQETATQTVDVQNYWELQAVDDVLENLATPIFSWHEMIEVAQQQFQHLVFLTNLLDYLEGIPFQQATANSAINLLAILNELKQCFDSDGNRTKHGQEIIQNHFHGQRAYFTDESETNKTRFRQNMTFVLPNGDNVFCPFHGKISSGVFRMHFTWPIAANEPLCIVYIGPKITKS